MKIIYIVYFKKAGASIHIDEFAEAFKKINSNFIILDQSDAPSIKTSGSDDKWWESKKPRILSKYGHAIKRILKNFSYWVKESRILKQEKPDIIIVRPLIYSFSAVILARIFKIPVIVEVNAPIAFEVKNSEKQRIQFLWLIYYIEKLNMRLADAVIVVTDTLKDYISLNYRISKDKIFVNQNGVDPKVFFPKEKDERILQEYKLRNRTVIGFVGSFTPWHGVTSLVQVILSMQPFYKNLTLILVGNGPLREEISEFIKEKKLEEQIILIGQIRHDEIMNYISVMDITVMPCSNFYGSPLKVFEYMAMGKAVIAPNNGPLREIITHNVDGCLINDSSVDFEKTLRFLIERDDVRKELEIKARKRIVSNFTWDDNAKRVWNVCRYVLSKNNNSSINKK